MTQTNSNSLWFLFVKFAKRVFQRIQKSYEEFSLQYPTLSQFVQLTCLYFFALIDLIYSVLNSVFSLGYFPEVFQPFYPFISTVLQSPIFRMWSSPEKIFFISYVVIEFMVVRSAFKFSKLMRYNILLLFATLMLQGLLMSYWEFLFQRQIAAPVTKWAFDQGSILITDKPVAIFFFANTFLVFFGAYAYFYLTALRGQFATFPAIAWLTDSVSFWLRIRTSTMRFGNKKKK